MFNRFLALPLLFSLLLLAACANSDNPPPSLDTPPPSPAASATETPAATTAPIPAANATETPAATAAESPAADKTLTLRYWQAPSLPFPYLSGGNKDWDAAAITLEPLANIDPAGQLIPTLAAAIPTRENGGISPDGQSITWPLQPGVQWSDGSFLTAADVVFTWRYCTAAGSGCTALDAFAGVERVTALDDLTVKIDFAAPTPWPYTPFVGFRTPIIQAAQFAGCLGPAAADCAAQNQAPAGTGPYYITAFTPNATAVYERNPYYRAGNAYFDQVLFQGGGTAEDAARAVLESGAADYAWNLQMAPDTLAELESLGRGSVAVAFASTVERIAVNQTNPDPALGANRSEYQEGQNPHPFLTFAPIRAAMSLAIDRRRIAEELYGFAAVPTCNLVDGPPAYRSTTNNACLMPDIAAANRLLEDLGVVDSDGDGIREYQGIPLRLVFQTADNAVRRATQEMVRDWWREIGIETALIQHDAARFFGGDPEVDPASSYRRFFADVQMYAASSGIDPRRYFADQLCGSIQRRENRWAGGNIPRSCHPAYDELFAQLSGAAAGPERAALVQRLNDLQVGGYYEIPLVNRGLVSAYANNLQGVRVNGWDSPLWNIAEWRR